jgi:hypothetical protein
VCLFFPAGRGGEGVEELRVVFVFLTWRSGLVRAVAVSPPRFAVVAMAAALVAGLGACSGGFVLELLSGDYWRPCARHRAGLNDRYRSALLLPVLWHSSTLRLKWCVPGGAVAGWRRWWSSIWKKKLAT